jgi:hypothetical protein
MPASSEPPLLLHYQQTRHQQQQVLAARDGKTALFYTNRFICVKKKWSNRVTLQ